MERWPDLLPAPLQDPFKIRPGEAISRTDVEAGPARQRREFTQVPSRINCRWRMTGYQLAVFEGWYKHKADEGGEWFIIPLLCGLGLLDHEARFVRQYDSPKRAGGGWYVDAEIEVRKRPTLTEPELSILLDTDLFDLQSAVGALVALADTDLHSLMGAS